MERRWRSSATSLRSQSVIPAKTPAPAAGIEPDIEFHCDHWTGDRALGAAPSATADSRR